MDSVADIFDRLGGVTAVAAMLDSPLGTVSAWKSRDSIPAEHWSKLIGAAVARGVEGVSYEALARIAAARRKPAAEATGAAA